MIKARAGCAAPALVMVGAGVTACGAIWLPARAPHTTATVTPLAISCRTGFIGQRPNGTSRFTPGGHSDPNGYEVTFTNSNPARTGIVEDLGIGYYDAAGAEIGSDTVIGSKTVASGRIPVAPTRSVSVIFYGPGSGFRLMGNSAPAQLGARPPYAVPRCPVRGALPDRRLAITFDLIAAV
jgi:hypothetical protein